MARMYARRRGTAGSVRPYRKEAPEWSNTDAAEIEKIVVELRKDGMSSSQIGLALRDRYGVPDVKLATGKRVNEIPPREGPRVRDPRRPAQPDAEGARAEEAPCGEQEGCAQRPPAPDHRIQGAQAGQVLRQVRTDAERLDVQTGDRGDPALPLMTHVA